MENKPYNQVDHSHCFESENPPCGIKGKHRCCLCLKSPQAESWEKEFDREFDYWDEHYPLEYEGVGKLKRFITSLLHSREEEVKRIVEELKSCRFGCFCKLCGLCDEDTSIHCGECVMNKPISAKTEILSALQKGKI